LTHELRVHDGPSITGCEWGSQRGGSEIFENRVSNWDTDKGANIEYWPAEVVATAVTLSLTDAATTGKMHTATRMALERMWTCKGMTVRGSGSMRHRHLWKEAITMAPPSQPLALVTLLVDTLARRQLRPACRKLARTLSMEWGQQIYTTEPWHSGHQRTYSI
jgi:hypothetical protein